VHCDWDIKINKKNISPRPDVSGITFDTPFVQFDRPLADSSCSFQTDNALVETHEWPVQGEEEMLAVRLREQENCTTTGRLYLSTEEEIDYSSLTAPGEQPLPRTVTYHMGMHPDTKVKHVFNATRSSDASSLLFHITRKTRR